MLVYCDSMILIYLLDSIGSLNLRAVRRITALRAASDAAVYTDLTRLECRVKPARLGAKKILADFDAFFTRPDVRLAPINTAVFDRATLIRAAYGFKLGDSLHLAAAVESHCDRFLTYDLRLSSFPDIAVEVLP